jgi:hypothetical protein
MTEDKSKDPFMAISTIIIILAAVGAPFFLRQTPYKSLRPGSEISDTSQHVRARLWQDPFTAVLNHVQSDPKEISKLKIECCQLFCPQSDQTPQYQCKTENNQNNYVSIQIDINSAQKKAEITGSMEYTAFSNSNIVGAPKLPENLENTTLIQQIEDDPNPLTILGVMVHGAPYAEETEFRIRTRVAVLSALRRLEYAPKDAEHIQFIQIQTNEKQSLDPIAFSNILPYEWMKKNDSKDLVLILWLNEDAFQKNPLYKLNCLFKYLRSVEKDPKNLQCRIIGPAGSTGLLKMIHEIKPQCNFSKDNYKFLSGLKFYSPNATVSNELLLEKTEIERGKTIDELFKEIANTFERTISTDDELAILIVNELENRQIDILLYQEDIDKNNKDHIVFIAEWDTFYGRC